MASGSAVGGFATPLIVSFDRDDSRFSINRDLEPPESLFEEQRECRSLHPLRKSARVLHRSFDLKCFPIVGIDSDEVSSVVAACVQSDFDESSSVEQGALSFNPEPERLNKSGPNRKLDRHDILVAGSDLVRIVRFVACIASPIGRPEKGNTTGDANRSNAFSMT